MRTLMAIGFVAVGVGSAAASPCGSDASSFDSFSDSSSDYTPEPSPPCEGPCAEYNGWRVRNLPAVIVDIGVAARSFVNPLGAESGTVTHDMQDYSYRVVGPSSQSGAALDNAVVAQIRLVAPMRYGFYAGGELELGGITGSQVAAEMITSGERGMPTLVSSSMALFGGVGVAGFGGRLGAIDLGVEVAAGGRAVAYSYDSTYGACETSTTVGAGQAVLEGRARASWWISPRMSLTATAGKSALDDGMVGGLSIGFSNQPHAGR